MTSTIHSTNLLILKWFGIYDEIFSQNNDYVFKKITPEAFYAAKEILYKEVESNDHMHSEKMQNIVKPYPFNENGDKSVYVKVLQPIETQNNKDFNEKDINSQSVLQFSVLNKDMLKLDGILFSNTSRLRYDPNLHESLENHVDFLHSLIHYRPYIYKFFAECTVQQISCFYEKYQKEWFCAEFIEKEPSAKDWDNQFLLHGEILFSASPIHHSGRTLALNKEKAPPEVIKNIQSSYKINGAGFSAHSTNKESFAREKRITDEMDRVFHKKPHCIDVFNVGQGNYIQIQCDDKRILFDIGYTRKKLDARNVNRTYILDNQKNIAAVRPDMVILSHWDLDHILAVAYSSDEIYKVNWVAPDINCIPDNQKGIGAQRLSSYLHWRKKLDLVEDDHYFSKRIFAEKNKRFELWQGKGKVGTLNKSNNFGLIAVLKNSYAVLPGDCEYKMWPDYIACTKGKYKFLVVPHHGSDMLDIGGIRPPLDCWCNTYWKSCSCCDLCVHSCCILCGVTRDSAYSSHCAHSCKQCARDCAIISFGENIHSHPNVNHRKYLKCYMGYCVTCTEESSKVEVDLAHGKWQRK